MTMCMEAIMATAVDTRNNRVVVLVSDAEKRRIAANARAADLSVSDYMRRAAERYSEPTDAERAPMKDLLVELERANAAPDSALVRLEATDARAAAFDEPRYRAETPQRLAAPGPHVSAGARALGE